MGEGWLGSLWGVRGGRALPVLPACVGHQLVRSSRDHSGITATWHHLEPESLKPVFPPPCSAAIGNCSGYLAAKWHCKNKQMHPKQHLAPTTGAGSGCSWQGAGREVAAPSPRGTSWLGVPTTPTEDETDSRGGKPPKNTHQQPLGVIPPSLQTSDVT